MLISYSYSLLRLHLDPLDRNSTVLDATNILMGFVLLLSESISVLAGTSTRNRGVLRTWNLPNPQRELSTYSSPVNNPPVERRKTSLVDSFILTTSILRLPLSSSSQVSNPCHRPIPCSISVMNPSVLLIMRVYALYNRSLFVLVFMCTVAACVVAFGCVRQPSPLCAYVKPETNKK